MKLNRWTVVSLSSLILIGSVGITLKNQAMDSPATQPNAIAQTMMSPKPTVIRSGQFTSGEHPTQGTARIVNRNGKIFLELDQGFKTSNMGPDLVVILHRSNNVLGTAKPPSYPLKSGDYVLLAPLKKFSGAQQYAIPAGVKWANYQSAVIWCRKFNATFGAARLN